jgi:hypothetical protein
MEPRNRFRQDGNRFLGCLKDLKLRAQMISNAGWSKLILPKEINANGSRETLIGWKFGKTTYAPL